MISPSFFIHKNMIVSNLTNKIHIVLNETSSELASYIVREVDPSGCILDTIEASGLAEEGIITFSIDKDGFYIIEVTTEDNIIREYFSVYYNEIPDILRDLSKVLCPCSNCENVFYEDVADTFFRVIAYATKTNFLCNSTLMKHSLSMSSDILKSKKDYEKYYGSFNFSFEDNMKKTLINFYIELYYIFSNGLKLTDNDLNDINNLFKIDHFEKCFYKKGVKLEELLCLLEQSKCNCNE